MKFPRIKRKIYTFIKSPRILPIKILYNISPLLNDEDYLKLLFPLKTNYKLNLKNPTTFNEKLQWLKINYRQPIMTHMVDKYNSKEHAKKIIGEEFVIKSYGVWERFEDIDFDKLPNKFVLKTTHDQGGVIIVNDKNTFDIKAAKLKINEHLKTRHYYLTREWPYKNVAPRVIAEVLLTNSKSSDLLDYKFYCFHGEPKLMYISHSKQNTVKYLDFFDMQFNRLDIKRPGFSQSNIDFDIPDNWELMKDLARKLSKDLPHLRVDFYNVEGKVYLGELTFFQGGGMMPFKPARWDDILGNWIDIESVKKELGWEKK
uniref:ATP-grasp fold amidoligase family protein n=1 Tax=uncultured Psychrobacter sp. TaxID=259303 RepID=UPI00260FCFD3|nr:ATP-grasp fold amidoligase family protein [uncultured Psychrobacter sp.]